MKELIRVRVQYVSRQQCCKTHKRPLPFYLTDKSRLYKVNTLYFIVDGFGGQVVSMLASSTQVCGFKPGRSRWIFTGVKILNMPSSGGEVKESVPCPSFATCKRT